ncbi:hypothetical protein FY122_00290 [Dictyoglomus thermophilum]|uniref:hypothetical protein n=1 Tax=Dictyoglomus thermophilum TaxID=14 RepID=UPI0011EA8066|nr:hypothetical protein [Dictyoglomus thermophilum]TYT24025.1 hypothetical protein FY122_00290 [Dictyoglomus thermophilum]
MEIDFPQSIDLRGSLNLNLYYSYFSGDSSLNYSSDIKEGFYLSQNSQFSLNYSLPNLSLSFNYLSQPIEKINLSLATKNFLLYFGSSMSLSISPLTLYNKILNGIYGNYKNDKSDILFVISQIESKKKIAKIYGNNSEGPYFIGDFFLIPNKERVFLNGRVLERDTDYIIDYTYGILYFSFPISQEDELLIEYEVSGFQEIYNLYGFSLSYSPIRINFVNLQDTNTKTNRRFLEGNIIFKKDFQSLEIRRSFSFLGEIYSGYADYIKYSLTLPIWNINFEYLFGEKNYPYIPQVLGNLNLIPGEKIYTFNLKFNPSFIDFLFNFSRGKDGEKIISNAKRNIYSSNILFSYKKENDNATTGVFFTYTKAFLNLGYQKEISQSYVANTYSYSFQPKTDNAQFYISISKKNIDLSGAILEENQQNAGITFLSKSWEIGFGENYKENINLNPSSPIDITQNFITDGYNSIFELNYVPIQDISIYINNIYVENNGTFTYYLPDGTYETYTVSYTIEQNLLNILFEDETGKNPPPSGLTISVNYKAYIPLKSISKTDTFSLKLKFQNLFLSFSYQKIIKDLKEDKVLTLSTYGMILPSFWINITGSTYLGKIKNNISLNANYYFNPSSFYFGLYYNEIEDRRILSSNINLKLSLTPYEANLGIDYYRNEYSNNYFQNIGYNINLKRKFNTWEWKGTISQNWKSASYNLSLYRTNLQSLSISFNYFEGKNEFLLSHEGYSNSANKYTLSFSYSSFKLQDITFYIKYVYNVLNDQFLSIYQIGVKGSINF